MSTDECIQSILNQYGYARTQTGLCSGLYYKHSEGLTRLIVVVRETTDHILTRQGLRYVKRQAKIEFPDVESRNVLILYFCRKCSPLAGMNVLQIDENGYLHGVCNKFFHPAKKRLRSLLRIAKMEQKQYNAKFHISEHRHGEWAVFLLIFLNLLFAVTIDLWDSYINFGINYDEVVVRHDYERLVTYMFAHLGIRHIVCNMISLFYIGKALGRKANGVSILLIYVLGGLGAGYASMYWNNYIGIPTTITVGASGAIFALLGALVCKIMTDPEEKGNRLYFIRYAIVTLVVSSMGFKVDGACHLGGFVAGIFIMACITAIEEIFRNFYIVYIGSKIRKEKA